MKIIAAQKLLFKWGGTMVGYCGEILFLGGEICKHRCPNARGSHPLPLPLGWPLISA